MSRQRSRERITEARVSPPRAAENYGVPASPDNGQKHLPPTAPPMMLRPFKCVARSVYFMNSSPMLVSVPVDTSQAVFDGVAIRALYVASR